ncbi:MAG: thiamine-phosphate kinase [Pirellulales bacterium]
MELDLLKWMLPLIQNDPRLEVPAGDDAAVLRTRGTRRIVITVDMLTEGVDFVFGENCSAEQVGHKALAVNLSDLAAMAAQPEAIVVSVCLPQTSDCTIAKELFHGIHSLASQHDMVIAGGDTNTWDGGLVISITALGSVEPQKAWRRHGAQKGDRVVVTGPCGGSILGRHLNVAPRCREARMIAERFSVQSAIDISDGLSLDLSRMMSASETGCVLHAPEIPIHDDAKVLSQQLEGDTSPLEHALTDGEDFELLLTLSAEDATQLVADPPPGLQPAIIGEVTAEQGLFLEETTGKRHPLSPKGFVHVFSK